MLTKTEINNITQQLNRGCNQYEAMRESNNNNAMKVNALNDLNHQLKAQVQKLEYDLSVSKQTIDNLRDIFKEKMLQNEMWHAESVKLVQNKEAEILNLEEKIRLLQETAQAACGNYPESQNRPSSSSGSGASAPTYYLSSEGMKNALACASYPDPGYFAVASNGGAAGGLYGHTVRFR